MTRQCLTGACILLATIASALATETENIGIRIPPAPEKMAIDGKFNDWDLSAGIFACGDAENLRAKIACWFHAMYDAKNLYILARWIDTTPLNNPGSVAGDMGFQGDCLQVRTTTAPDDPKLERTTHITAWSDRNGLDVIDLAWGKKFDQGGIKDAKSQGGQQAFLKNQDGTGYVQELSLPWTLLAKEGFAPRPGDRIVITVEPNFGTEAGFRITLKDLFRPGVTPDRVFTFMASNCWGFGTFLDQRNVKPQTLHLADNREFQVRMEKGVPVIDWTGLYETRKMEGFEKIALTMPDDGHVSLNIRNAEGQVVRQLLSCTFMTRGKQEVLWDGLTNLSHTRPGEVVPAGDYTWEAIWHTGIGLRLVGWAHNGGRAPFDSPGGNWGGDMGNPWSVDTEGEKMFLGWSGSEAGKAVVATDLEGNVLWRQKRGGFGGARLLCADANTVYVYDQQRGDRIIYRLDTKKGDYTPWQGREDATLDVGALLKPFAPKPPEGGEKAQLPEPDLAGMDAAGGQLFLSCTEGNVILVINGATGQLVKSIPVDAPGDLEAGAANQVHVLSAQTKVLRVNIETGKPEIAFTGLKGATAIAIDAEGSIYVGEGDPANQVKVFGADGTLLRTIGKAGGRPLLGPWEPDGMRFIRGLRVDARGKLWVMEDDAAPRRVSVRDSKKGSFIKEFFGPTNYGAGGGAICPTDPYALVGQGCEWRISPETGRDSCVAVFHRGPMGNSRFGVGSNGRVYLAIGGDWHGHSPVPIYERLSPGQWKLRTLLEPILQNNQLKGMRVWADANDDQQRQDNEVRDFEIDLGGWINGWYMPMTQTLTFYGGVHRIAVTGFTACGAPLYDLSQAKRMPAPEDVKQRGGMGAQRGCGSEDGRLIVYNGHYGEGHSDFRCYDIESGKLLWTYPNTYVGVHGGHHAPPPQVGLIRAAYDIVGTARLPDPIGHVFLIPTDKGEWHILTGDGFYLTPLFQGDAMKIQWPEKAVPGAVMDNTPPGMGAEDFGGSMICTRDGALHVQAGKTAFINLKVIGLDSVKKLGAGRITVEQGELAQAQAFREKLLQQFVGARQVTAKKRTVAFSADIRKDFGVAQPITFAKSPAAAVEATIAYDDATLYLGWQVNDDSPWVNGAGEPEVLYASGDTVDFQLGTDPGADRKRGEAVGGDLRLSIGNFRGKPTAVIYRRVAQDKKPRTFYSGVVRDGYVMESVKVAESARVEVKVNAEQKRYVVEAAIPLKELGLSPKTGDRFLGDFGATHGDKQGSDTVLRTYWNNQATGIVADEVFELKMEPKNWGEILFE